MNGKTCLLILLVFASSVFAQKGPVTPHISPSLKFTENKGQWKENIRFRAQLDGGSLFLENNCLTWSFYDKKKYHAIHLGGLPGNNNVEDHKVMGHAFKVYFKDCNPASKTEAFEQGPDYENFYIGRDPSKWKGHVTNYHRVWYRDLYKGIDYEVLTAINGIKYNFHVKPGADPDMIKLKYSGIEKMELRGGNLHIKTSINEMKEEKPFAYQLVNGRRIEVPCKYKLEDSTLSFTLKGYNPNYELVIDPLLVFAAESGSTADNFGMTATFDAAGNLVSGGTVFDTGYPTTVGAYSAAFTGTVSSGNTDVVVTKYNSTGTALIFSTYLGGTDSEIVTSLIVDNSNNLYLYGATGSADFPVTSGSYDNTFNGGNYLYFYFNGTTFNNGTDIYVAKFNSTGTSLLGSTFIGGSDNDGVNHTNSISTYSLAVTVTISPIGYPPCVVGTGTYTLTEHKADSLQHNYGDQYRGEIQLDKNGDVYISSSTRSTNFPAVGGFKSTLLGNDKQDAVIVKLNSSLSSIMWSSYLGGSGNDAGYSLIVDDSLQVYATGGTFSMNFPVTPGCYQTTYNGGKADGYIVKINAAGNAILKGTYIGTGNYDQSYFIQSDRLGNIYVYGQSLGTMPIVGPVYSNPGSHQFVSRLDRQLSNINMSTVFGSGTNKIDLSPSAFSVDKCSGTINMSGWGGDIIYGPSTTGMPVTPGAFQSTSANGYDFYLFSLYPNATALKYASYFGGSCSKEHVDGGTSRFSETGQLYQSVCAGCGGNEDFPVSAGAWPGTPGNPNHSSNCNNGVFKFDFQPKVTAALKTSTISGCAPLTVTLTNLSSPGLQYLWNLGTGPNDTTSAVNPVKTYTAPGTYTVTLLAIENLYCNTRDSTKTVITVFPGVTSSFTDVAVACSDTVKFLNTSVTTATSQTASWSFGDATGSTTFSPVHVYSVTGTYTVQLISSTGGCSDTARHVVHATVFNPSVSPGDTICRQQSINLSAGGGTSYSWTPSASLSSPNSASPTATPSVTTTYSVVITDSVTACSRTLTTQIVVNPKPTANFSFSVNPCGGGVYFTDLSTGATQWNWDFGSAQTSTVQNAYNFYSTGGTYSVSLIVKNNGGCSDTIMKPVSVGTPPPISVSANTVVCLGGKALLSASGGFAYSWSPASNLSSPATATTIATPTASTTYSVIVSVLNSLGDTCHLLLTSQVSVAQISAFPVSIDASPDTVLKGNSSTLSINASPGAIAVWSPITAVNPIYSYTTVVTPEVTSTYTVVITRGPCTESLKITVYVLDDVCSESDVYIPNTFTPNGDGENDIMYVRGAKIVELYFAIYNRWGEMVFETRDKNVGWDGVYKGRQADVGVFGYYVKAKCINGLETFRKGNITLIR